MDLKKQFTFEELTNDAVEIVIEEIGKQLSTMGYGGNLSEDYVLDLAAYALNHVKPMYRVNLLGRIYADNLRDTHGEEIRTAVTEAIQKISKDYRA